MHHRQFVIQFVRLQLLMSLLTAVLMCVFSTWFSALAALAGGGINIVGSAYFALRTFSQGPGDSPQDMVNALYKGETLKIALVVSCFIALAWQWSDHFLATLLGYCAAQSAYWFALLMTARKR